MLLWIASRKPRIRKLMPANHPRTSFNTKASKIMASSKSKRKWKAKKILVGQRNQARDPRFQSSSFRNLLKSQRRSKGTMLLRVSRLNKRVKQMSWIKLKSKSQSKTFLASKRLQSNKSQRCSMSLMTKRGKKPYNFTRLIKFRIKRTQTRLSGRRLKKYRSIASIKPIVVQSSPLRNKMP